MRIVIPTQHYFPDKPSGADRLSFDEAEYLAKSGHEVWLVSQDIAGDKPEHRQEHGINILSYRPPGSGAFNPNRRSVHQRLAGEVAVKYIRGAVDIIHGHSCLQYEGVMDSFGAKPRKCFSVHSPVKLEIETDRVTGIAGIRRLLSARMLNRVERGCLARSDLVTTDSKYTHMLLRQLHGEEIVGAAEIVPGWVDVDRFRILDDRKAARVELGWPVDRPVLFTLRRLVPRMGVDRLLAALSEVSSGGRDFMMVIAGEGPMKRQLETMAGDLSLGGRVKFAGFVKDEQLPLMYGAADAFILPTAELECFGLIAIESLACGRPVLATPVAAIPEIIGEIEPSWLAKDESAASIANLIKDFCSGKIPMLEPEVLRRITEQRYSKRETLPKLVAAIIDRVH